MAKRKIAIDAPKGPRPRRGSVAETRERLVTAAAEQFGSAGYDGTDSTKIAARAGYAAGTFYKHFDDKREAFIAVYEQWVDHEWQAVRELIRAHKTPRARAQAIVRLYLELHATSRVFRASLRVLAATDSAVRKAYQEQRRRQLDWLDSLQGGRAAKGRRERNAMLLYSLERTGDALADGEDKTLVLDRARLEKLIEDLVMKSLIA